MMNIETINLPKSERFPCSKRDVREALSSLDLVSVAFRHSMMKTYRYANLSFDGQGIANAGVARQRDLAWLYIFPVQKEEYPCLSAHEFKNSILPKLRAWFETEIGKQETACLATVELFIVWHKGVHSLNIL